MKVYGQFVNPEAASKLKQGEIILKDEKNSCGCIKIKIIELQPVGDKILVKYIADDSELFEENE